MVAPNLSINAEPSDGTSIQYLRLAPDQQGSPHQGQLALVTRVTNNEPLPVVMNQLEVSFAGGPGVTSISIPLNTQVPSGNQRTVAFERVNIIIIPVPVPDQVNISIICNGFADPAILTMPLDRYLSPVPGDSYLFFARATDLRPGEYWQGRSAAHASGSGTQLFGYDMTVVAYDQATGQWSRNLPGTSGNRNIHSRVYGKPIYAMADGTVLGSNNDFDDNARGGDERSGTPVEGNHFWIQHGTDAVLYAHLQPDSMEESLMAVGAVVDEGQLLGHAGNSGNSSGPHVHMHIMQSNAPWGGSLRPLPFRNARVLDRAVFTPPDPNAPWSSMEGDGPPRTLSLILPDEIPQSGGGRDIRDRGFLDRVRIVFRWLARLLRFPIGPR